MTEYRVVAEAVHVSTEGGLKLIYKGAPVPPDQDPKRLKHLLDTEMIAPVGEVGVAPNAAVVPDEFATTGGQRVQPESGQAEIDRKRDAAKAKLPADGSAPDGRAAHEVWVEYAVAKGLDRQEAEKASKDDLKSALAQK